MATTPPPDLVAIRDAGLPGPASRGALRPVPRPHAQGRAGLGLRGACGCVTSLYAWTFFRTRGHDAVKVPASGPVILAPNHFSFMDHFFLGAFVRRRVSFMAKSQLFKPPMQWIFTHGGVFPVRRGYARRRGVHHRERGARARRRDRHVLRGRPVADWQSCPSSPSAGIGRLALESGAPVVPVAVHGSSHVRNWRRGHFPKVTWRYGDAIQLGPAAGADARPAAGRGQRDLRAHEDALRDARLSRGLTAARGLQQRGTRRRVARDAVDRAARERRRAARGTARAPACGRARARARAGRRAGRARSCRRRRRRPTRLALRALQVARRHDVAGQDAVAEARREALDLRLDRAPRSRRLAVGPVDRPAGRGCRPRRCACPAGARVGSATDCWPKSRNGRSGSRAAPPPCAVERPPRSCRRRGRCPPRAPPAPPTASGPSSAQSTFTVGGPVAEAHAAPRRSVAAARRPASASRPCGVTSAITIGAREPLAVRRARRR